MSAWPSHAGLRLDVLLSVLEHAPRLSEPVAALKVFGLSLDSRECQPGDLFIALPSNTGGKHGISYAGQAIGGGALAVIHDAPDGPHWDEQAQSQLARLQNSPVPCIEIAGLQEQLAKLAVHFFAPSKGEAKASSLNLIGVTGTNGKTTCCHLIAQALEQCAYLGTLGYGLLDAVDDAESGQGLREGTHTTPDVISLQRMLAELREAGAQGVALEVSSHALDQGRVAGLEFAVGVFTNLSRDHLDYHGDMQAYEHSKTRLFVDYQPRAAVINLDDPAGQRIAAQLPESIELIGYSMHAQGAPDVCLRSMHAGADGLQLEVSTPWGEGSLRSALVGRFNAANLLAVIGVLGAMGMSFGQIQARLERLQPVPGRMQKVAADAPAPLVVVDYAHTPDALEQALAALREHTRGELICVFGCGGERDRGKRPQMGAIAARGANRVVITDDNPRSEDGDQIVADILSGLPADPVDQQKSMPQIQVERDRKRAIHLAVLSADLDDTVLLAGKGHENYQINAQGRVPFSDYQVAHQALRECHS